MESAGCHAPVVYRQGISDMFVLYWMYTNNDQNDGR